MKILLAIDDSKFSEAATQTVIQNFRPDQVQVCVLHVVEPWPLMPEFRQGDIKALKAAEKRLLEKGQELVDKAKKIIGDSGFKVQSAVQEGDHRARIIDYAKDWNADLIVLGSHGRKGLDRFLLGSVAEFVARHSRCSVLIVRSPSHS